MSRHSNDRDRTSHQVERLRALGRGRGYRRKLLAHFAARRGSPQVEPDGLRRVPFRLISSRQVDNDDVPVVPDQLTIRAGDVASAREALESAGYAVEFAAVPGFDDLWTATVTVRAPAGAARSPSSDLRDIADLVRNVDNVADASLNHVAALAGRAKGGSTPEPTDRHLDPRPHVELQPDPRVVVVDTGIDRLATPDGGDDRRTDGWLDDISLGPVGPHIDLLDTVDYEGDLGADGYLDLAAGHGTFVAGTIRGVAPRADVTMLRVLDTDGFCDERALAEAIRAAGDLLADAERGILNLSLGVESVTGNTPPVGIARAIEALPEHVLVVAAAGNGPTGLPVWPAALENPRVLGVASVYDDGSGAAPPANLQPSDWSNRGEWVDFSALGEGVVSTFVAGCETPSQSEDDPYDDDPDRFSGRNPYALWSGTSFSAAKVTGHLVNAMANDPRDVLSIAADLKETGKEIENFGVALHIPEHMD